MDYRADWDDPLGEPWYALVCLVSDDIPRDFAG